VNEFAVQSFAHTTPFDAVGVARAIHVPTLIVHSENALAPPLARMFIAGLRPEHEELWIQVADSVSRFFTRTLSGGGVA
jgi:hypothetical protein